MNIFMTVGSMLPFDRLVVAMDEWAAANRHANIFAQIGDSRLRPRHFDYRNFVSPTEFRRYFDRADLIVSHVGMGTVITAMERARPLIMLPRRRELGEVTSDHQLATARWLQGQPGICVVYCEEELAATLSRKSPAEAAAISDTGTKARLVQAIRRYIES